MAPPPHPAATDTKCAATLRSLQRLASYSDTLADFFDQWNSVLLDVASIATTVTAKSPDPESVHKLAYEPNPAREPERDVAPAEPEPTKPSPQPERNRKDGDVAAAAELRVLCEKMSARDLRRFLTTRLPDREWLRVVGPDALRRAPDPAALVLRSVGRYYIAAESRDAEAACVLLLELYVRAGCPRRPGRGQGQREAELQEEVRESALTWRSRLVRVSGRLGAAGTREARGLTLFMAAFGVPPELPPQEVFDLLAAGDSLSRTKVLRCSKIFVKTMRDIVVEMLNKAMYLQAIRIVLAFEFQNAFPLAPTLTHIMEKVERSSKKESDELGSEHGEEELALLRLISKCIEDHKLCSSEFSSFGIADRITLLEQRIGQPKQAFAATKRKRRAGAACPHMLYLLTNHYTSVRNSLRVVVPLNLKLLVFS